jgi:peroxiredoxin
LKRVLADLRILAGLGRRPEMLKVGDKAPDFTTKTHEGKEIRLSDLKGSNVVLWFYPKADTPG